MTTKKSLFSGQKAGRGLDPNAIPEEESHQLDRSGIKSPAAMFDAAVDYSFNQPRRLTVHHPGSTPKRFSATVRDPDNRGKEIDLGGSPDESKSEAQLPETPKTKEEQQKDYLQNLLQEAAGTLNA